ncbi:hypothetical protein RIF29_29213 [Crotalaria pallida]|uniref:Uncharacterized protein n=1 Tax=Crotalaria pallida TaxID=3830 RepID=A0AAN9EEK1_CROPI
MRNLQNLQGPLRSLNVSKFHDIDKIEAVCRDNLIRDQAELATDPLNLNFQKAEKEANQEWLKVSEAAILFIRQKAKGHWLKDGDQDSSFFHAAIKMRRYRNRILSIRDEFGNIHSDEDAIGSVFLDYYKNLLNGSA